MEEQQQATSEGKSSKNPSSGGSRSGGAAAAALGSPPPSSPQIVVNSKESGQAGADQGRVSARSLPAISSRHEVWGVLTAISDKAKSRAQGSQILLFDSEHVLGRSVKDPVCQFDSLNVSAKHCTIFRKRFKADESYVLHQGTEPVSSDRWLVYIKDSSSNGTFINCQKLKRDSPEARIKDGDIISLVNAPEHENAFAFLYEEIKSNAQAINTHQPNGSGIATLKRKSLYDADVALDSGDSKRVRGLGIGGPDGPVSLDDVRRLQRSNEELRNQLEAHLLTIEKLRAESRSATARHDAEVKELQETLSAAFLDQIRDLRSELLKKEKELESSTSLCTQQQSQLEDRNRSLAAAIQSRKDADEVIKSQKLSIGELKDQLEDEHNQRRREREKAESDLRAAVERARLEATEELKRQSDSAAQQLKEHLEMINKLQEADRENRSLIESLRSKLEDARETVVKAERASRTLELRLQDEESCSALARKKIGEKELELQSANKELQEQKAAKEKALSRLSAVEVEMETAIRDLQVEQQRLQGARERIVLRETQLRAFHSTAEEIAMLQQRQQEQLQEMMKVLEDGDEENHLPANNLFNEKGAFLSRAGKENTQIGKDNDAMQESGQSKDNETVNNEEQMEDANDADSQTTASNSGVRNKATMHACRDGDTQMDECNGAEIASREAQLVVTTDDEQKGSAPSVRTGLDAGHTQVLDGDNNYRYMNETQELGNGKDEVAQTKAFIGYTQLVDTQSKSLSGKVQMETQLLPNITDENVPVGDRQDGGNTEVETTGERNGGPVGETLLLEDEDTVDRRDWGGRWQSQLENQEAKTSAAANDECERMGPPESHAELPREFGNPVDIARGRINLTTTADLMASEVAGSWAYSTAASVHCDNGGWSQSQVKGEVPDRAVKEGQQDFDASQVGGPAMRRMEKVRLENSQGSLSAWNNKERRDLNVMLDIVAPEFSRLHGLDRVMETAPDSEEHTEEDEDDAEDEGHGSENAGESEPVSQSVSLSARY